MLSTARVRIGYMHQEAQRDHRPAKSPEDGKEHEPFYQAESHHKAEYGEFQEHQPHSTFPEELRQLTYRAAAAQPEECPNAGREHENRSTNVGDPPREKQNRGGASQILRLEGHGARVKILARVIQRHDDHDEAAQSIYRSYPGIRSHVTRYSNGFAESAIRGEPANSR